MKKQINRIHKKMCLFTKIKMSRVCLERKDSANLKYLSKDITKLYNEFRKGANKKEKKFLNRVKLYTQQ